MSRLEEYLQRLTPSEQQEVEDFARFLAERRASRPRRKMRFAWAGALKDLKDISSVDLQHQITDMRIADMLRDKR